MGMGVARRRSFLAVVKNADAVAVVATVVVAIAPVAVAVPVVVPAAVVVPVHRQGVPTTVEAEADLVAVVVVPPALPLADVAGPIAPAW